MHAAIINKLFEKKKPYPPTTPLLIGKRKIWMHRRLPQIVWKKEKIIHIKMHTCN
jgi:hypothetical protein